MTILLFANDASSTLAASITNTQTTMNVSPGSGALFPHPTSGQAFQLTFTDAATQLLTEIVQVSNVSGDTFTMLRGQENTTALAWTAGDIVAMVMTAGTAGAFLQFGEAIGRMAGPPQLFTSTTSDIMFPSTTNEILYIAYGGGGSGGPAVATTSNETSVGSGGNVGSRAMGYQTSAFQGMAIQLGAGGASGPTAGAAGGNTILTFTDSTQVVATGGAAGTASSPQTGSTTVCLAGSFRNSPGSGSTISNNEGIIGGLGISVGPLGYGQGGVGASCDIGTGGLGGVSTGGGTVSGPGGNAQGYAAGGGGSLNVQGMANLAGGTGANGWVLIFPLT